MSVLRFVVSWAILFGTYLLFVDQLVGPELIAGAVSSLLVTAYLAVLYRSTRRRFGLPPHPRFRLLAMPGEILRETLLLSAAALRPRVPEGSTRTIPFDSDTGLPQPQDAGRRAIVVGRLSLSPNGFVVLRQREPGTLLIHDMLPATAGPPGTAPDRAWPA